MQLVFDKETIRKIWGSAGEFWFSRVDYTVHSAVELNCDDDAKLVENGFIPFLTITNEEMIRAYIKSLNNSKVSAVFDDLYAEECVETFWKYFNAYSDISSGFDAFEKKYVDERLSSWCEENSIEYRID